MDKQIEAVARAILKAEGMDYGKIDRLDWDVALRKAKAAIAAYEASTWLPIEELQEGERALVKCGIGVFLAHLSPSGGLVCDERAEIEDYSPTHFRHITPPSNEGE